MDETPQSNRVITSLRPGDLVGCHQWPECELLVVRWPEAVLRFIALGDVVVPF